jgi:Queuine tRNA-ribosyltransferase
MLRQCFPARHYPHLVLGMAVRDTCVVPAAATSHRKEEGEKKKPARRNGAPVVKDQRRTATTTNPRTAKKKGHAFASASNHGGGSKTLVDPWLLEYRRMIVPTFDLWDDDGHYGKDNSPNGSGGGQAPTNGSKGKGGSTKATSRGGGAPSSSATALPAVSSNDKIWLKTPQGRLPLSADAYMDAALHLTTSRGLGKNSEYVVPLFDAIPPPPPTTTTPPAAKLTSSTSAATTRAIAIASSSSVPPIAVASTKRKVLAVQRCQNWHRQCVQHIRDATRQHSQGGSGGSSPSWVVRVLAPVVLDPTHRPTPAPSRVEYGESSCQEVDDEEEEDDDDDLLLRQLRDQRADDRDEAEVGGSVLIGWHALDNVQRKHVVKSWQEHRRLGHGAQPIAPIPANPEADGSGFQKKERGAAAVVVVLKTRNLMQFLDAALLESDAIVRSRVLVACDLPSVWSRNRKAFVLRLPPPSRPSQGGRNPPVTTSSRAPEKTRTEAAMGDSPSPKRPRIDPNSERDHDKNDGNAKQGWLDENGCVNLSPPCDGIDDGDVSRHPWFRDASPVIRDCPCATCRHHTRAYIYHLVCAKELLGEVLLFVHNLHHMLALVERINEGGGSTSDSLTINEYVTDQLPPSAAKERAGKVLRN